MTDVSPSDQPTSDPAAPESNEAAQAEAVDPTSAPSDAADSQPTPEPSDEPSEPVTIDEAPLPATQVLPTGLPGDSREVGALEAAGRPSPAGLPLAPLARELLEEFDDIATQFDAQVARARRVLAKVRSIGAGLS